MGCTKTMPSDQSVHSQTRPTFVQKPTMVVQRPMVIQKRFGPDHRSKTFLVLAGLATINLEKTLTAVYQHVAYAALSGKKAIMSLRHACPALTRTRKECLW
jgi:hypothetical protein